MNSRIYRVLALASIIRLTAIAEEGGAFLKPVDGYLSSYGHNHFYLVAVRDILVRGAVQSPAVMVTLPSFQPESMVYILPKGDQVFVVSATVSKQIWSTEKKEEIKVEQKEKAIKAEIADQIGSVFAMATSQTHYPKEEVMGLDGVTYHFSSFVIGIGVRAGQTWSPDPHSTCGMLVTLGEHLHRFVRGELSEEELSIEAKALLKALKKNA
jgi:hypothetical protein